MKHTVDRTVTAIRLLTVALIMTLIVGAAAPAMAAALTESRAFAGVRAVKFASTLAPLPAVPTIQVAKAIVPAEVAKAAPAAAAPRPAAKAAAPLPKPVAPVVTRAASTSGASGGSGGSAPALTPAATTDTGRREAPAAGGGIAEAKAILARYISTYPILQGTTVDFGDARGNAQAIAYYKSGRIIINPNHTVSLERIIGHEIWHIIDWRDNGQIDWGESVPPANANDFKR